VTRLRLQPRVVGAPPVDATSIKALREDARRAGERADREEVLAAEGDTGAAERALRARHEQVRCLAFAALPAGRESLAFVLRLDRFLERRGGRLDPGLLEELADGLDTTKRRA